MTLYLVIVDYNFTFFRKCNAYKVNSQRRTQSSISGETKKTFVFNHVINLLQPIKAGG